ASPICPVASTRDSLINWHLVGIGNLPSARTLSKEETMPKIRAGNITMNYDQQGSGEPLVLIPYLAADYACYAFQVADYSKHFTCISVDLRGTGESDKPAGVYSTEMFADDVAALMQ